MPTDSTGKFHLNTQRAMAADRKPPAPIKPMQHADAIQDAMAEDQADVQCPECGCVFNPEQSETQETQPAGHESGGSDGDMQGY